MEGLANKIALFNPMNHLKQISYPSKFCFCSSNINLIGFKMCFNLLTYDCKKKAVYTVRLHSR